MAKIALLQIAFCSLVMGQQSFSENNILDGWWFHLTPARNPFLPFAPPCLLRSQPVVKRDDYTYTEGIGGHKVHKRPVTWPEARRTCEEEGGHLAIINSVAEANVITELFEKAGEIRGTTEDPNWGHIGFHDFYENGEYITIHGQTLARAGYTEWRSGQPDNHNGGESCGSVHRNGGLNDVHCEWKCAFICEMPIY